MPSLIGTNIIIYYSGGKVDDENADEIAEKTIELRQQFKTKTPDAIIAATALVHGLSVATHNTDDFKRLGVETVAVSVKLQKE